MWELYQSPLTRVPHDPEYLVRKRARLEYLRAKTIYCDRLSTISYTLERQVADLKHEIGLLGEGGVAESVEGGRSHKRVGLKYIEEDPRTGVVDEEYWEQVYRGWDLADIERELMDVVEAIGKEERKIANLSQTRDHLQAEKRALGFLMKPQQGGEICGADKVGRV